MVLNSVLFRPPIAIGTVVVVVFIEFQLRLSPFYLMWIFLGTVVIIKGLSYSLNSPTKEIQWIPTSDNVKFKTKIWIDVFGTQLMKGTGSGVTDSLAYTLPVTLLTVGTAISLALLVSELLLQGLPTVHLKHSSKKTAKPCQ